MTTTIDALSSNGSIARKYVVAISGYEKLLTDATAAQVAATTWSSLSWTSTSNVLEGVRVELTNDASITPKDSITTSGRCTIRIPDGDNGFGSAVFKRVTGAETVLTAPLDRDTTTVDVKSTTGFPAAPNSVFIGVERIYYTGKTATTFTGCSRGMYSPFETHSGGSGYAAGFFGETHRFSPDDDTQQAPVVSQLPRTWIGRRVAVHLHTISDGALNSKSDSQRVFAGKIAAISDDAETGETVLELEHVGEEIRNGVVGVDQYTATLQPGLFLSEGRTFRFVDRKEGYADGTANNLEVVASGASGTNQINEGVYSLDELAEKIGAWLAGEKKAGRIYGYYSMKSPVTSNVGLRTVMEWKISDASQLKAYWELRVPGEVSAMLGFLDMDPADSGQTVTWRPSAGCVTNQSNRTQGVAVPFTSIMFKPFGPGRLGQEFATNSVSYECENERGVFYDQYESLPAIIKNACQPGYEHGLFMLDDKQLLVASYDSGLIRNAWIPPLQTISGDEKDAVNYYGRRADEPEAAPLSIKQIYLFESTFHDLLLGLLYSTGTTGYNHATYDTLPVGVGLGIPGVLLNDELERSVNNLTKSKMPLTVMIDEPTPFGDLIGSDLAIRRAFLRFKDQGVECASWQTPTAALAVSTVTGDALALTESTKAIPTGTQASHRTTTTETAEFLCPVVKIDYNRDFGSDREPTYLKTIWIKDLESAAAARASTLKMRNVFKLTGAGADVEALVTEFLAFFPVMSRPVTRMRRTIDPRYWEQLAPGDIVTVTDAFARDPLTGNRGITARPAFVTRVWYSPNGMTGEVDLLFIDVHRGSELSPAAQVDESVTGGGFTAGYNSGTKTIRLREHAYSNSIFLQTRRGTVAWEEADDATNFVAGDAITIVERDPSNTAAPLTWDRNIVSVTGNDVVHDDVALAAFDTTKQYVITAQRYTSCQASQKDAVFQADDATEFVQSTELPWHYSVTAENYDFTPNNTEKGELIPDSAAGDGRPEDPAHLRTSIVTVNAFIDYKSAHQSPFLWDTPAFAFLSGYGTTVWAPLFAGPIYLGLDGHTNAVTRYLTVAPLWKSNGVEDSYIRVTLSRVIPQLGPSISIGVGTPYNDPQYVGEFSQAQWGPYMSGTLKTDTDATLSIAVKDLFFGYAWLVIEGAAVATCYGLGKCIEGPRVTP